MTKQNLIDLIRELLSGGDAPAEIRGKYHPRVVEKYLEMAYDDVISISADEGAKAKDFSLLDEFATPYTETVLYDTDKELKYCPLPVLVMPLPGNAAMRSVSPPKDPSTQFVNISMTSQPIWKELEADYVDPKPGYWLEGERMYFDDMFPYGLTQVMMKIVSSFGDLGKNDRVAVPAGKNTMIFQRVFELMQQKKQNPEDYYGDNNNKQV
jgi:hypothetical protein